MNSGVKNRSVIDLLPQAMFIGDYGANNIARPTWLDWPGHKPFLYYVLFVFITIVVRGF